MRGLMLLVRVLGLVGAAPASGAKDGEPYDDFHYPVEEPAERATAAALVPTLVRSSGGALANQPPFPERPGAAPRAPRAPRLAPIAGVVPVSAAAFQCPGSKTPSSPVGVNGVVTCGSCNWKVQAIWTDADVDADAASATTTTAALEQTFRRWSLLAFVGKGTAVLLRKPVGELAAIEQPWFNLSDTYQRDVGTSLADLPAAMARNRTVDGEVDFPSLAATLAPQRDTVAVSHAADVVKFAVAYSGRVKCATVPGRNADGTGGGVAELQDLHAPPPDSQLAIFDPADHLKHWPRTFANTKTGIVGGHLGVANVGAYTAGAGAGGFELVAFGPVPPGEAGGAPPPVPFLPPPPTPPTPRTAWQCWHFTDADEEWIAQCEKSGPNPDNCQQKACVRNASHAWTGGRNEPGHDGCGTCFCCAPYSGPPVTLPRLPNINYNPGVYTMLRDEAGAGGGGSINGSRYFYSTNQTTKELLPAPAGAAGFYAALLAVQRKDAALLAPGMRVELPASDRRQADMAQTALLATSNNFVGDQPNYGFGATYWSVGREDNGSLPLDMLSVDEALLEWGVCGTATAHIAFYLDNYIAADGHVVYTVGDWVKHGDSIADYGRLIDLYLRATRLCRPPTLWRRKYLVAISRIGGLLLRLRAQAPAVGAGVAGLIIGAPEHDFSGDTTHYYYNNNVWSLYGMEELGAFLVDPAGPDIGKNTTLGAALLADARAFREALAKSITACTVPSEPYPYLPVYATLNATKPANMHDGRDPSYANFRFYSEPMLTGSSVVPIPIQLGWLQLHNARGGRIGGASRWEDHLDDMPTAGWGYGALVNNQTDDFLALMYGQMATYQSRGSFHSTEQLSFLGSGRYRAFLHITDPVVPTAVERLTSGAPAARRPRYFGTENDVSFCIVSNIIVARLTRWQLVFEQQGAIWLGRGAPQRWFRAGGGFNVTNAPTAAGPLGYRLSINEATAAAPGVAAAHTATYTVELTEGSSAAGAVKSWSLRWPGRLLAGTVKPTGCTIAATDPGLGLVTVTAATAAPTFAVTASWCSATPGPASCASVAE